MNEQMQLNVEEREVPTPHLKQLRRDGFIPANMYGRNQKSLPLQVDGVQLQKLLARGGSNVILLKVGSQPAVQVLIKDVQRHPVSGKTIHVDFYRAAASEKLRARVQLHFVNEAKAASLGRVTVSRPLNEVMVESLPADLPGTIQVDLSGLSEVGAVIRVGDLAVGPGVTILTDHNEMVASVYQQSHGDVAEAVEAKTEADASTTTSPQP